MTVSDDQFDCSNSTNTHKTSKVGKKSSTTAFASTAPAHTPLFDHHNALNAKMIDFGGWMLPVNYGSQVMEHHAVRDSCGMFDVSHMTVTDVIGDQAETLLSTVLANDIARCTLSDNVGTGIYSCLLNHQGGVIDDLIVTRIASNGFRIVSNASTRHKVWQWLQQYAQGLQVAVMPNPELALIAVQGPNAIKICQQQLTESNCGVNFSDLVTPLKRFQTQFNSDNTVFISRTGYTGEDGVEIIADANIITTIWELLIQAGVQPCGLGARDTLRLESGMSLYGNDLDEQHTPDESGIAWTVNTNSERDFIGKSALQAKPRCRLIGLELLDKGVLRGHQTLVHNDQEIGETTSGTFSPSLEKSIALARINRDSELTINDECLVQIRQRQLRAKIVKIPFVKNGKPNH